MPENTLRVTHVLRNLRFGGLQNRVLNLIKELPSFAHSVVVQSPDNGELYVQYQDVCDLRQCVRHPGRSLDFFLRLTAVLRELKPDVVLAHLFGNHTLVAWAAYLARVPATYGVSTNDPLFYAGSRWKPTVLAHLARPVSVGEIAVSEAVGRILRSGLHLPASRVHVVPNGCPVEEIARQAQIGKTAAEQEGDRPKRAFMAARLGRTKDHATLLKAAQILHECGSLELWLAGTFRDSARTRFEALLAELGVHTRVKFLGPRGDIAALMGACDVVVLSTRSEGLPNSVLEAMAAGVPVVATDIPACREVLDGGRCGILVSPGDPETLASAIRQILSDEHLRHRLTTAAFERVSSCYHVKQMAAGYANLLRGSRS
ncbi:MAG: glycosyltransferase family 4 protein [Vicinamibacterales bacterium]